MQGDQLKYLLKQVRQSSNLLKQVHRVTDLLKQVYELNHLLMKVNPMNHLLKQIHGKISVLHRERNNFVDQMSEKDRIVIGFVTEHCRVERVPSPASVGGRFPRTGRAGRGRIWGCSGPAQVH
jgi:hypothetical protein